jgi:hypothetical protein
MADPCHGGADAARRPLRVSFPVDGEGTSGWWKRILAGEERRLALTALEQIVADLQRLEVLPDWSLDGAAGLAILYQVLADAGQAGDDRWDRERLRELCRRQASLAVAGCNAGFRGLALHGGYCGVAWMGRHCAPLLGSDGELDDVGDTFADIAAVATADEGEFDLISGLAGLGVYCVKVMESVPTGSGTYRHARACFEVMVRRLLKTGMTTEHHDLTWCTPARVRAGRRFAAAFDLGMAHGAAGVVAMAAQGLAAGADSAELRELLGRTCGWLLRQRRPGEPSASEYPSKILLADGTLPAGFAWCYGDPGVGIALLQAGRTAGHQGWTAEGIRILQRAAALCVDEPQERWQDAALGLCHGPGGLAHLFNRAYQTTGMASLAEAARGLVGRMLWLRDRPPGGFLTRPRPQGELGRDDSFMTGAIGGALVLCAALYDAEPTWDRLIGASAAGLRPVERT